MPRSPARSSADSASPFCSPSFWFPQVSVWRTHIEIHHKRGSPMRFTLVLGLAILIPLSAKDKKPKSLPQDTIEVVAHIAITSGPVLRLLTTEHYSSHYLYAEHAAGAPVTLIDTTKADHPAVLAEVAYPSTGSDSLVVVSGTAALVSNS